MPDEAQLRTLWRLAFGDSEELIDGFFAAGYDPARCQTICLEGRIAAALYWFDAACDGQKLAYIYAVATHPDFRRRGLCRALMTQTQQLLARQGYAGALLVPAQAGLRRMYAGMGYRDCGGIEELSCAAGKAVPLERICPAEYAARRRSLLPDGGAVQEGPNLAYLSTLAGLYAGADFLLAAAKEGTALRGAELLGSREAAPGILGALGCETGVFRVPGGAQPFAMFRPLTPEARPPRYFGLAFD